MSLALSDLWRRDATIGRGPYLAWGVGLIGPLSCEAAITGRDAKLFALKHLLDRGIAAWAGDPFQPHNYWLAPGPAVWIGDARIGDPLYRALLVTALPFILAGVWLTVRRLNSAGLPRGWVVLFFIPVLNLVFFLALSIAAPITTHAAWRTSGGTGPF